MQTQKCINSCTATMYCPSMSEPTMPKVCLPDLGQLRSCKLLEQLATALLKPPCTLEQRHQRPLCNVLLLQLQTHRQACSESGQACSLICLTLTSQQVPPGTLTSSVRKVGNGNSRHGSKVTATTRTSSRREAESADLGSRMNKTCRKTQGGGP